MGLTTPVNPSCDTAFTSESERFGKPGMRPAPWRVILVIAAMSHFGPMFTSFGSWGGDTMAGSPPQLPKLVNMGPKWDIAAITKITRQGAGRMPGFPNLSDSEVKAVSQDGFTGVVK